ncbi:hypothetical protein GCM10010495_78100 [Kitasatospora herbaricolor]|nr:hypothetical protein [Kitasatospora herbaricolor]GGV48663.1 hypothetical protein GCM10010495_78100 [Kitasatospora herbaricolor]
MSPVVPRPNGRGTTGDYQEAGPDLTGPACTASPSGWPASLTPYQKVRPTPPT